LTDLDASVTDSNSKATDLHLLTMFQWELIPVCLSVGNRICMCGQDKFLALLLWFESIATLYLRFRKFQIQDDIFIISTEEDNFLIVDLGRKRVNEDSHNFQKAYKMQWCFRTCEGKAFNV
jgi:hypothetical protein